CVTSDPQSAINDFCSLAAMRRELRLRRTAALLRTKRIVGMTVTGASIQRDILRLVRPSLLVVEEAAEVGEPQLLACLSPSVQHLVLIGDHKQLRPPTESHRLARYFDLDVSMFERLINNGISYDQLALQNRMRPELSQFLRDIYPGLKDNLPVVTKHQATPCVAKSAFFWDHSEPETGDRSYINKEEAERCVALALFLISQGVAPSRITILAAYRSQTALISQLVRQRAEQHQHLFPEYFANRAKAGGSAGAAAAGEAEEADDEAVESRGPPILAHTVDVYQGDENDFVIVSLVRSNEECTVGFLKEVSRRCVAQSRARCGFWLIGNADCLTKEVGHWRTLLKSMREAGCVGKQLPLRCVLHPAETQLEASDAASVPAVGAKFCTLNCDMMMECGLHRCPLPCQPRHSHDRCAVRSEVTLPDCGHRAAKLCHQSLEELRCCTMVDFAFEACGHPGRKECWQPEGQLQCLRPCDRDLPGCGHRCQLLCWERCAPESCAQCRADEAARNAELQARRQAAQDEARREAKVELEAIKKQMDGCVKRLELTRDGESASEFLDVEDRVLKYIRAEHSWYPTVNRVEKVLNASLKRKFLSYKSALMFEPDRCELKFHGTSAEGVEGIITSGFRLPEKAGMYGAGIYFASDSSKSAREIYTKGSNMLMLCEVLLGRSLTVLGATKDTYNFKRMRQEKYDSLFAPRNSRATNGVMNDEFVVFEPAQAYPKYIVHYSCVDGSAALKGLPTVLAEGVTRINRPQRHEVDQNNPLFVYWSLVNSRFLSGLTTHGITVTQVQVNQNSDLLAKFEARRLKAGAAAKAPYGFTWAADQREAESVMKSGFSPAAVSGLKFTQLPDLQQMRAAVGGRLALLCKLLPSRHAGSGDPGAPWSIDSPDCAYPRYAIHFSMAG
uniref:Poly [ADP-ribose] polymerase n=1 Tax=Macrostomum lignano TaxID=282301 RepID=A0A1I8J2R6_9PLAT